MSRNGLSHSSCSFRPGLEPLEVRWVPANVGTANQNFIDQVYRDVLHRAPDPGAAGWVAALDTGTDREDVVHDILNSDEGLRNQVNDLYVRFLGRTADAGGLAYWTDFLRDDDNDNIDLAAQLIASNEYYRTQGGGTDAGFLNAVYQDVLGRPISADEIDDRGDDFSDGVEDRADIAEDILESGEGEDVRARLTGVSFLGAGVTARQIDTIAGDDEGDAVYAQSVLSGSDYYNRAQGLTTSAAATIPSTDNQTAQPLTGA